MSMFTPSGIKSSAATASYETVSLETGVASADPYQLVLMLFDGALAAIAVARARTEEKQIAEKGAAISKAISIIGNGLHDCLNYEAGGELAERLGALYDYMVRRLIFANLENNLAALDEVAGLLRDIRSAWEEIADKVDRKKP